jgi:putative ABC transport system ATP-binding protein
VSSIIELRGLSKDYRVGTQTIHALRDVDLDIPAGQFVAIMGASGSGKSTLLNLLGALDQPTRGGCRIDGSDTAKLGPDALAALRNRSIGFVFQNFNLLARSTALENVELPALYRGWWSRKRRKQAQATLKQLGLGDRMDHLPAQLSGGQQQRVAMARALVTDPPILLADEPTGNLDSQTAEEILTLISELHERGNLSIIMVTHDSDVAEFAERAIVLRDGRIIYDEPTPRAGGAAVPSVRALHGTDDDGDRVQGSDGLSSAEPIDRESNGEEAITPGNREIS